MLQLDGQQREREKITLMSKTTLVLRGAAGDSSARTECEDRLVVSQVEVGGFGLQTHTCTTIAQTRADRRTPTPRCLTETKHLRVFLGGLDVKDGLELPSGRSSLNHQGAPPCGGGAEPPLARSLTASEHQVPTLWSPALLPLTPAASRGSWRSSAAGSSGSRPQAAREPGTPGGGRTGSRPGVW